MRRFSRVLLCLSMVLAGACALSHEVDELDEPPVIDLDAPLPESIADPTPPAEEEPPSEDREEFSGWQPPRSGCADGTEARHPDLDVLVVFDTSAAMLRFRPYLSTAVPYLADRLLSGREAPAAGSLRVGFVSAGVDDTAAVPFLTPWHSNCGGGDWLDFPSLDLPSVPDLRDQMECVMTFDHASRSQSPLSAMARALDPSTGFVRPRAMLVVLVVTAGDDISGQPVASFGDQLLANRGFVGSLAIGVIGGFSSGAAQLSIDELAARQPSRLLTFLRGMHASELEAPVSAQSINDCLDPASYCESAFPGTGPAEHDEVLFCQADHPCPVLAPTYGAEDAFWSELSANMTRWACE